MRRLVIGGLALFELLLFVAIVKTSVSALFPLHAPNVTYRSVEFTVPNGRIAYRVCFFCKRRDIEGAPLSGGHEILLVAPLRDSG